MRRSLVLLVPFLCLPAFAAHTVVSFDPLLPAPGAYLNNDSFAVAAATFLNSYSYDEQYQYESWSGFALSTVSNATLNSYVNQYAAIAPFSRAYAVAYHDAWNPPPSILFDQPVSPRSLLLNNTTYAALTIRDGDAYGFSQPFSDGDYFLLTLSARDLDGNLVASTNHFLADYRSGKSFVQTNWTPLDLSWMPPTVASLVATLETTDLGAWGPNTPMYFALADFAYAYPGLDSGIASTNPAILAWASHVHAYSPGPNVSNPFLDPSSALGPAQGSLDGLGATNGVVSLGDAGSIVLSFPAPLADGPGPDFAVFENAFSELFLELARVEVSSDGTHFFPFPSHSLATGPVPTYPLEPMEPESYAGLAGKHLQGNGTPFDLRVLAGTPGLDLRRVTHLKIVDVPGDGSALDSYGNPIYDPTPTWGSGGFDLDAVAALHLRIDLPADPSAPLPSLPGYQSILERKASLSDPEWLPAPDRSAPGFYRLRLAHQ